MKGETSLALVLLAVGISSCARTGFEAGPAADAAAGCACAQDACGVLGDSAILDLTGVDTAPRDAGGRDAGALDRALTEAGSAEGQAPDAGSADGLVPDAGAADAGPPPVLARGQLRAAFQNGGTFALSGTGDTASGSSSGTAVAVDGAGRVTVAGILYNAATRYDVVLVRFDAAGDLAPDFGANGVVQFHRGNYDYARAIVLLEDGQMLVGGSIDTGTDDPTLWRFAQRDGARDWSFGSSSGYTIIGVSGEAPGMGLARDPTSGASYIAGGGLGDSKMYVVKFLRNGWPDNNFGPGAKVEYSATPAFANAVAVDSLGRVIVTGRQRDTQGSLGMALWRFLSDGTPDASLGGSGLLIFDGAAGQPGAYDSGDHVLIDPADDIYVIGSSSSGVDLDLIVWKLSGGDGQLDASFGQGGVFRHHDAAGGGGDDTGHGAAFDHLGNLVVVGKSLGAADADLAVWRLTPRGALDLAFGQQGVFCHDMGANEAGLAVALSPQGLIYVAGTTGPSLAAWALE